jgi:tRNA(adenine34) deaminase
MLTLNHKTMMLMSELMSEKSRANKSSFADLAAQGDRAALTSDERFKDERSKDEHGKDERCNDEHWMEEALRCAQRALESGEVPVGAVVVCEGRVVGRGWNRNLSDNDPSAHAEIVALREAGRNLGNHRLGACELFVTIEPCAMCAGAMTHARLRRLVYGADDAKAGAVHSILQVVNHAKLNHRMEVQGAVLAGRAAEMLQDFFRKRREPSPGPPQLDGDSD